MAKAVLKLMTGSQSRGPDVDEAGAWHRRLLHKNVAPLEKLGRRGFVEIVRRTQKLLIDSIRTALLNTGWIYCHILIRQRDFGAIGILNCSHWGGANFCNR